VHGALPAAGAGGVRAGPPPRHIDVQDEVRRLQPAALVQQPAKDGGRDGERRVGHDVERSPGSRRSAASALTRVMSSPNRSRSASARPGCRSTAMTRAPEATNGPVSAPKPAPMSSTRSPGPMPEASTMRSAQVGSSWCQPHRRRDRATATHHHADRHADQPCRASASGPSEFRVRSTGLGGQESVRSRSQACSGMVTGPALTFRRCPVTLGA